MKRFYSILFRLRIFFFKTWRFEKPSNLWYFWNLSRHTKIFSRHTSVPRHTVWTTLCYCIVNGTVWYIVQYGIWYFMVNVTVRQCCPTGVPRHTSVPPETFSVPRKISKIPYIARLFETSSFEKKISLTEKELNKNVSCLYCSGCENLLKATTFLSSIGNKYLL